MTLIELLFWYRDLIKDNDREEANRKMHKSCDREFWWYIEGSVNDDGEWIDVSGKVLDNEKEDKETIKEDAKETVEEEAIAEVS